MEPRAGTGSGEAITSSAGCEEGLNTSDNRFEGSLLDHVRALDSDWQLALQAEPVQRVLVNIDRYLQGRLEAGVTVFPAEPFRALHEVRPEDVRVVLLGQDPYHGPGQAQGLAFSVPDTCRTPPSLRNMFAELAREYPDRYVPQQNNLLRWARQGVLLLNTALTVEARQAGSHARCGWTDVTDTLLARVLQEPQPKVFLLWGAHAQARRSLLDAHTPAGPVQVLAANHPSPLSATRPPVPFIGCDHFSLTNQWLQAHGDVGIDWLRGDAPASQPEASGREPFLNDKRPKGQGKLW